MTPTEDSIKYPANTKQGYMTAREGDGLVTSRPCLARGTVQPGTAPTLTGCDGCGTGAVVKKDGVLKVRELTPLECWRLMGQTDEAYYRAAESTRRTFKNGNVSKPSKTALYKAAGNSIVVDVLVDIFEAMYKGKNWITPGCVKPGRFPVPYTPMWPLEVVELFSGIGAQRAALERTGIPFVIKAICDTDPRVTKMYRAIYKPTEYKEPPNLGDIRLVGLLPYCDLLTYTFPCQDISRAGKRAGMSKDSNTRSALVWEVGRLLNVAQSRNMLPPVLFMENVPAILDRNNIEGFKEWIAFLESKGYTNSYAIINAKDHGIPQNRNRCFMVSALRGQRFVFPEGRPLETRLKDFLEPDVGPEYYLSEQRIATFKAHKERHVAKGSGLYIRPLNADDVAHVISTKPDRDSSNYIVEEGTFEGKGPALELAGTVDYEGCGFEAVRRVYDPDGIAPTITTAAGGWRIPKIAEVKDDASDNRGRHVQDRARR